MSKTYRRKNAIIPDYGVFDYGWINTSYYTQLEHNSKEYKKRLAIYHSDNGTHSFKEPGPHWFRRMYSDVSMRRKSKIDLRKYVQGEDIEIIIDIMPPLPYWTLVY